MVLLTGYSFEVWLSILEEHKLLHWYQKKQEVKNSTQKVGLRKQVKKLLCSGWVTPLVWKWKKGSENEHKGS